MHLGIRHRTGLEPAVQHFRNPTHRRLTARVIRIGAGELVDERAVQVVGTHAEVALELVETAVHVDPRVLGIVGHPHGDGRTPVPVAADVPVLGPFEPLTELAVPDVLRRPLDLLVELHHPVAECGDRDEPRGHGHVDQRLSRPP